LPGYSATKQGFRHEKHKNYRSWEGDLQVNAFSPAVFDAEYYSYRYGLKNQTRNDIRSAWLEGLKTRKTPECQLGHYLFSLNKYIQSESPQVTVIHCNCTVNPNANPQIQKKINSSCYEGVRYFLTAGIFTGNPGRTFCAIPGPVPKGVNFSSEKVTKARERKQAAGLTGGDVTQQFNVAADQALTSLPTLGCPVKESYMLTFWINYAFTGAILTLVRPF
jgi:hypothetical protein